MIIKKFNDLDRVEDNMIVDLSELEPKQFRRAIDFLTGLTYKKGSLTKLEKNKFLVRIGEI